MNVGSGGVTVIVMGESDTGVGYAAYAITSEELVRLIAGGRPAADAPDGFEYIT